MTWFVTWRTFRDLGPRAPSSETQVKVYSTATSCSAIFYLAWLAVFSVCFSFCGSQNKRYNRAKAELRTKKKTMARGEGSELPSLPPPLFSVSTSVRHSRRFNSYFANHTKKKNRKNRQLRRWATIWELKLFGAPFWTLLMFGATWLTFWQLIGITKSSNTG